MDKFKHGDTVYFNSKFGHLAVISGKVESVTREGEPYYFVRFTNDVGAPDVEPFHWSDIFTSEIEATESVKSLAADIEADWREVRKQAEKKLVELKQAELKK